MDGKDQPINVSHYFKEDKKSIFDDISTPQSQEQNTFQCKNVFVVDNQNYELNVSAQQQSATLEDNKQEQISTEKNNYKLDMHAQSCLNLKNSNLKMPSLFSSSSSPYAYISDSSNNSNVPTAMSFQESMPDELLEIGTNQSSNYSNAANHTYDTWIPSQATKEILNNLTTSPPGSYSVDTSFLTMPGIAIKEEFGDPIKNLLLTYLGEEAASKRHILMTSSVTQDDRGLRQLISAGCYHAAVNLTTQLLTIYGQGDGKAGQPSKHTAHSIQLWFTRLALLAKLRRFSLAEVECEPFRDLDAPDLYYEYYPELYGGRKGSMVPFSFRILVAILPQFLGKHIHALDRLSNILAVCDKSLANLNQGLCEDGSEPFNIGSLENSIKTWKCRRVKVLYSLTNCAVAFKDLRLASGLLQTLLKEDPDSMSGLFAALGRLCLQLGDIPSAQEAFKRHLEFLPMGVQHDPVQGLIHSAFVACAQNNFQDATQILQQAYKIAPNNALVTNNLSVCLMFVGKIRDAIKLVEESIMNYPQSLLHEALILNLSTMYELESSNAHKKKMDLLQLVSCHKGDGFNIAALKLQVS